MFLNKNHTNLVLYFALVFLFFDCNRNKTLLPEELYVCSLTKTLSGEDAKAYVDHLHLQNVASHTNKIGFYEGENGPITIYLTTYKTNTQAQNDYLKMTQRISPENSVFIAGEYITVGEKEVYRCFGLGQTHLVFVQGENLIWMSVDTIRAMKILVAYLVHLEGQ
jgi:hypothetical protein